MQNVTKKSLSLLLSVSLFSTYALPAFASDRIVLNDSNTFGPTNIANQSYTDYVEAVDGAVMRINLKPSDEKLVTVQNSTFARNKADYSGSDSGAISVGNGKLNVTGSSFVQNEADGGGAIYAYTGNTRGVEVHISDSVFENNKAVGGGALGNFASRKLLSTGGMTLSNVTLKNNEATGDGGGAMFLGAEAVTEINGSSFIENKTSEAGGAIDTRSYASANNQNALLDIKNTSFTKNTAVTNGGAIDNNFYNSQSESGVVYVSDSAFAENSAAKGGAIYNHGGLDTSGHSAAMSIYNSAFTGNTATEEGGAIYNGGTLNLKGTTTFSGNTAAGVANDIYNTGTLNLHGNVTMDGGVKGTGDITLAEGSTLNLGLATLEGTNVSFANNSTLGVTLSANEMGSIKATGISVGESASDSAKLLVTLSQDALSGGASISKELTNGTAVTNGSFAMAEVTNALYNVSFDNATNTVTAVRKSEEERSEVISSQGGNANNAAAINAFTSSSDLGSDAANAVGELINNLAQTDVQGAVNAATALAPEESASKQVVHSAATSQLFGAVTARMNDASMAAPSTYALGGDAYYADGKNYSVWAQGLLNKSHKEETSSSAFTGRSTGLAAGVDTKLGDEWMLGLGYAYLHTNVDSFNRHDRILGDNFLVYGQYRPGEFFVQAALNYGDSKYEESKYLPGMTVNADYHVKSYSANLTAGYELYEWLTPLAGVRYMNLQQEGYTDSADQSVAATQDNFLTALLGAKLQTEARAGRFTLRPSVSAAVAYDFVSDNTTSNVVLPGGAGYDVNGERLHRLSFEAGASVAAMLCDNVDVLLAYDGSFRQDYNSHTGSLKLRYMF